MSTIPCITVKKYIQINITIIHYIQKIVLSSSMEEIHAMQITKITEYICRHDEFGDLWHMHWQHL